MEAAEATYKRDKRALELGALPPLDIYRSESQVASRRVQVIQSEYALKQAEEALRLIIGANQDPYFQALDLELTETPDPETVAHDRCGHGVEGSVANVPNSKRPAPLSPKMRHRFDWREITSSPTGSDGALRE